MSGQGQPELSVDLNGALIDPGVKKSSRKNVFILNTFLGLQVLIQSDCVATTDEWVYAIQAAINNLVTIYFSTINLKFDILLIVLKAHYLV